MQLIWKHSFAKSLYAIPRLKHPTYQIEYCDRAPITELFDPTVGPYKCWAEVKEVDVTPIKQEISLLAFKNDNY